MAASCVMALLAVTIACWSLRPAFLVGAGLLLNFAAATWFLYRGQRAGGSGLDFLSTQSIAAAIPGIAWLVLELQVFRQNSCGRSRLRAAHTLAAIASTFFTLLVSCHVLVDRFMGSPATYHPLVASLGLISALALMSACLWARAWYASAGLYVLGLGAIGLLLDAAAIAPEWLPWAWVVSLAAYAFLTCGLFMLRKRLEQEAVRIGAHLGIGSGTLLAITTEIWAAIGIAAASVSSFSLQSLGGRLMVASAALSYAISLGLLSWNSRAVLRRTLSLCVLAMGAVLWGWAWAFPVWTHAAERCAILFVITSAFAYLYGLAFPRLLKTDNPWLVAASQSQPLMFGAAIFSLVTTILAELWMRENDPHATLHGVALAVLMTLLAACASALESALRPGNPPRLSDRARVRCVYAAEALLALALIHLKITEPQLFGGLLRPYWPMVVMFIAFAGVGAGELLRRQGRPVLSEPLERTGIFLPLLPVLGWWVAPAAAMNFGELLLMVAAFYAIVSLIQRSLTLAAVAALAGNGALWNALMRSQNLGFLQHPQLWLIPASLSLLAGAQLNRDRLTPERLRVIRYVCLILVYVSSTADIFLNGVDRAPWLPLVLAGLSVAGVMLGVILRIRAFLFLGTSFLLLSVMTMVWFASSQFHWTWIWYVVGIVLGTGILALFALFEKKREEMLAILEGLKQWE